MHAAEWLLKKLYRNPFIITRTDGLHYLRRYRLIKLFGYGLYIHEILQNDDDRAMHDHPFPFVTLVLSGGYYECLPDGIKLRLPGAVIHHKATDAHRLILYGKKAWTLFIRGPKVREWGFYTPTGWVVWHEYLKVKHGQPSEMD